MHDSWAGAFGIVDAFLLLLVKCVSLNSMTEPLLMVTPVLIKVVSRWTIVYTINGYG